MTDEELIELLAAKGMGWDVHDVSAHRPGSRKLPHVWKWRRSGGVRFMVYDGKGNREWNPLAEKSDVMDLLVALDAKGITLPVEATWETEAPAIGGRRICAAATEALKALKPKEEVTPDESVQG